MEEVEIKDVKKTKCVWMDYLMIMIGCTITSISINKFLSPNNMVMGGLAGIAIIIQAFVDVPIWLTNILVNGPLLLISIKQRGLSYATRVIFAVGFLSLSLWYTDLIPQSVFGTPDLFLCATIGAVMFGGGIGLVIRASASTGGTDLLASILHYKFKSIPISTFLLVVDSTVILCGAATFGMLKAMYALVAVYISSHVISMILDGMHFAKSALIISDNIDIIADELSKTIKRGATSIKGTGMYTKKERNMLYMIVSKKQIFKLQQKVRDIDPNAFISITDVREVIGKGFKEEL